MQLAQIFDILVDIAENVSVSEAKDQGHEQTS